MQTHYFIKPPLISIQNQQYSGQYKTYSEYNYLRPSISSRIKTQHFEEALRFSQKYFGENAIDFGCADGIFLLSLSKYFNKVAGFDADPSCLKVAQELINRQHLDNVTVQYSRENLPQVQERYKALFLLEVLEHNGDPNNIYPSQAAFLKKLFTLLTEDGIIIISVPKMVGLSLLIQRVGLSLFGFQKEKVSIKALLKACFLYNTNDLEPNWNHGHLGFNHRKLEKQLKQNFRIIATKNLLGQKMYVLAQKC